ncbi:MAG TPA: PAS domain S-box protein [Desulfomonilaceae bacterium]|nr:PAS domain S-box protein [Desulfomonilaceae bacterium]
MTIETLLQNNRAQIIEEWLHRLQHEISPRYASRPREELLQTVTDALDANFSALVHEDFSRLDGVIEFIGKLRGKAGFRQSEVQKAFEIFRTIMISMLKKEMQSGIDVHILERLNSCLAYTIHKFSDHFQELHEREITRYALDLEKTVEQRTGQLAESERKYRQLVEDIRDGYWVNQHGNVVFANQAFCDMHGYEPSEVIGKDFREFVAPESLEELGELYREWMTGHRSEGQYIYYRLHKNGDSLPTENKCILTRYQGAIAVIGICRDITERMEIEKRVREAERLAHIGQLTTSIAHEIRNPLSSAGMSIQDLLRSVSVSGNDKRRIEILGRELTRVNSIVSEMLDFAKPIQFDFKSMPLEPLVNSCLDILEAKLREKNVEVRSDFPEDLPKLQLDREKMTQAIINVLLNSIEAVEREQGRIEIHATRVDKTVRIEIRDNGQGVSGEDLDYVFDPFFSRKKKGTGLGLANAKKVIEAHHGQLDLRSVESGTCVSIVLPCSEERAGHRSIPSRRGRK